MIDRFGGMVVSWSIGTRPDAELVNTMLDAAIETVTASSDRPVVHSDRGGITGGLAGCPGSLRRSWFCWVRRVGSLMRGRVRFSRRRLARMA